MTTAVRLAAVPLALATLVVCSSGLWSSASAQAIRCSAFLHNADGSWSSFAQGTFLGSYGPIDIHTGERFNARTGSRAQRDVAAILDGMCRSD